jgi:hypothetical protein
MTVKPLDRRDDPGELSEEQIAELLRAAGPGDRVPDEELAPIRANAIEAWRGQVRRTARRRVAARVTLAIAAAVVLTIAVALLRRDPFSPAIPEIAAATIETVTGTATAGAGRAADGDEIAGGTIVATTDSSRAALRLATGPSVRIDVLSSVRVNSGRSLRLDRGAVYVDTHAEERAADEMARLEIETPLGTVTDRGTRFEVRLIGGGFDDGNGGVSPSSLEIRVRDGAIRLATESTTFDATAGMRLAVSDESEATRSAEAPHGDDWSWIDSVRPPVAIEGITCAAFLDWAARESGRSWRFSDPAAGADAAAAIVHGSIDDLTLDEALATVLPSCGLRHRIEGAELVIDAGDG